MKILYLGWIDAKNIGDDLMLENFKILIKKNMNFECEIIAKMCGENFKDFDGIDIVCLGGGSILLSGFINVINSALDMGKKVIIWGSSYDGMENLELINKIEKFKISYIYSDETQEKLDRITKEVLFFSVRGPITKTILDYSDFDSSKVIISGDPCFLLDDTFEDKIFNFSKKDNVIGINVGTVGNRLYGNDEKYVLEELIKVSNYLLENNYKIYLYTMWKEYIKIILEFYKKMNNNKNIILDIELRNGKELVGILKNCLFTINLKLHANIISCVANVPFICIGYRLKCYDFVKSINSENLLVNTSDLNLKEKIILAIDYIEKNNENIKEKFTFYKNKYKSILQKSLDVLN